MLCIFFVDCRNHAFEVLKYKEENTDKTYARSDHSIYTVINKAVSKRNMIMSQSYASILILMFALAGAAHGFCAHGIGGVGEYSGDCTDSIGKHDNTAEQLT